MRQSGSAPCDEAICGAGARFEFAGQAHSLCSADVQPGQAAPAAAGRVFRGPKASRRREIRERQSQSEAESEGRGSHSDSASDDGFDDDGESSEENEVRARKCLTGVSTFRTLADFV